MSDIFSLLTLFFGRDPGESEVFATPQFAFHLQQCRAFYIFYNNINIVFRINGGSYYKRISISDDEYRNKFINFLYNQKLCFYDEYTDIMLNTNIFHNKRHTSSLSSFLSIIDTIFVNNKLNDYKNSNFENNITIFFKSELFETNDI